MPRAPPTLPIGDDSHAAAGFDPAALGRHKSNALLDEYLELGDLFGSHPLSGVL